MKRRLGQRRPVLGLSVLAVVAVLGGAAVPARADVLRVGRDAPTVQAAVDAAEEGDVIEVPEGVYRERVVVPKRVTLRGLGGTLDGGGTGTVLRISAAGAVVERLSIRSSGADLGAPDACVYVTPEAVGTVLRDNRLSDCAFGIWIHRADRSELVGNTVVGRRDVRESDRGNGIHLFDASHLVVRNNTVRGARDGIYVSATDDSVIEENILEDQRYGIHYMYSQRNTLRGNRSARNLAGIALMQSSDLIVVDNVARDNERFGLLFRDAQRCLIRDNVLDHNGQGMFFFSSTENRIEGNRLVGNDIGMKIWAGSVRNHVARNALSGNRQQIFYVGAEDLVWGEDGEGNHWSDYAGWDQDGDGTGDRPYRTDSFTANLVYRYPSAVLLLRSPILELLTHLEARMPVLRVPTVIDRAPLLRAESAR